MAANPTAACGALAERRQHLAWQVNGLFSVDVDEQVGEVSRKVSRKVVGMD